MVEKAGYDFAKLKVNSAQGDKRKAIQRKINRYEHPEPEKKAYSEYRRQLRNLKRTYEGLTGGIVRAPAVKPFNAVGLRKSGGSKATTAFGVPRIPNPNQKKR